MASNPKASFIAETNFSLSLSLPFDERYAFNASSYLCGLANDIRMYAADFSGITASEPNSIAGCVPIMEVKLVESPFGKSNPLSVSGFPLTMSKLAQLLVSLIVLTMSLSSKSSLAKMLTNSLVEIITLASSFLPEVANAFAKSSSSD